MVIKTWKFDIGVIATSSIHWLGVSRTPRNLEKTIPKYLDLFSFVLGNFEKYFFGTFYLSIKEANPRIASQILSLRIQSPCQMMIGVYNHLLSKVFRFHYHSQKVIGSLGYYIAGHLRKILINLNFNDIFGRIPLLFYHHFGGPLGGLVALVFSQFLLKADSSCKQKKHPPAHLGRV